MMLVSRTCNQLATVATFLLSATFLNAELFGAFALASAATMVFAQLTHVGFHEYVLKERKNNQTVATVWLTCLGLGCVLIVVVAGLAHPLSILFKSGDIERLMLWWAITPFFAAVFSIISALAYNQEKFGTVAIVSIISELLALGVLVLALTSGLALDALLIHRLVIVVVPTIMLWGVLRCWIPFFFDRTELIKIFHFVKHFVSGHFIGFGATYGADIALGLAAGPTATGIYRFGARIVVSIMAVTHMPLATLGWTEFSKLRQTPKLMAKGGNDFLSAVTLTAGAPLIGLAAIADPLITRLAPAEWQASIIVVQILAVVSAVRIPLSIVIAPALSAADQEKWIPITRLINAVLSIAAILVLARYGVAAAALSQAVAPIVIIPLSLYLLRKHINMSAEIWIKFLSIASVAAALMWLGVHYIGLLLAPLHTAIFLPLLVGCGAVIYITLIGLMAPTYTKWFLEQLLGAAPEGVKRRIGPIIEPFLDPDLD